MSGSAFFVAIVVVVGVLCAIFITPILLIPAVVLLLIGLFAGTLFTKEAAQRRDPTGVPTTQDATYDPIQRPTDQAI